MKRNEEGKHTWLGIGIGTWMLFVAFMSYMIVSAVPYVIQNNSIGNNREAIECVIQQLGHHRTNNRAAHQADSNHHDYQYDVGVNNIPSRTILIDEDVCDDWLRLPVEERSARGQN